MVFLKMFPGNLSLLDILIEATISLIERPTVDSRRVLDAYENDNIDED